MLIDIFIKLKRGSRSSIASFRTFLFPAPVVLDFDAGFIEWPFIYMAAKTEISDIAC
jgi:hypothetical protein